MNNTFIIPFKKESAVQQIACCNWPDKFPYVPGVTFTVWHDSQYFHIKYNVDEKTVRAEQNILGGEVYMDSCVECFISPGENNPYYYNFEFNAAGKVAMARRTGRSDPQSAPIEVLESIKVYPSLGTEPFAERPGKPWSLEVCIPASALWLDGVQKWDSMKMRMNFYKCGDGLSEPHYITWQPIKTENPDYHRPEFFVPVEFE